MNRIYMDANATARTRPAVFQALSFFYRDSARHGNPSSVHFEGRFARAKLREARLALADLIQLDETGEIVFTSGGTEACNSLIRGFLYDEGHILASDIEHPAIRDFIFELPNKVSLASPGSSVGIIDPKAYSEMLEPKTALAILMLANNETGAIQPVKTVARMLRARGFSGPIICDATQAVGKYLFSAAELFRAGVSALAVSGHKFGAFPGVGAMVFAKESSCFPFAATQIGGPQESRFRAGTENMPGIISLGTAAREASVNLLETTERLRLLRDKLWQGISSSVAKATKLTPEESLSNTLLVQFCGFRGDDLVVAFDVEGLSVSTGAACSSGKQEASPGVLALGLSPKEGREVVRFSLDWDADDSQIEGAIEIVKKVTERLDVECSERNTG